MLALYFDRTGSVVLPKPTVLELGGGAYGALVPPEHEDIGVIGFFDGGSTASPRYQTMVASDDNMFAWHLLNQDGTVYTGSLTGHAIGLYDDSLGVARTAPAIVTVTGSFLFSASPSSSDTNITVRIDAPSDALPSYWTTSIASSSQISPVISNFVPQTGSQIYFTSSLQFDVTDNSGMFLYVVVMASYSSGLYEVIHDGSKFADIYLASVRSEITGGYRFSLSREDGWPGSPSIAIKAIDTTGAENL